MTNTMTDWEVAGLAETALRAYGYAAELELGRDGSPEMFIPLVINNKQARLHYATYAYEGIAVELPESFSDDYWEETPAHPRLEIDRNYPIGRQLRNYLDELKDSLAWKECPNHAGAFDCTPFCDICEGRQEINK